MKQLSRLGLFTVCLALAVAPAFAGVPQTIVIDGTNDFNAANLIDDDSGDTQATCDGNTTRPMDLGKVYLTNDANYLYFGFEYARHCYGSIDLGLAIDVNTPGGGATDAFGRKIGWANVPNKPDFQLYDVIPNPGNTYNYEVLYHDNGAGGWTVVHDGSGGLGIADADGGNFVEGRILLSDLGVTTGSTIHYECWVTQEGSTKGPLDAAFGDAVQMSRFTATTYDTAAVVQMPGMFTYVIQNAIDNTPPTLSSAVAVGFAVQANKTIQPLTTKVDVVFSEPVDATTSQVPGNYAFAGPSPRTVTTAVIDGSSPNTVHLTLNSAIAANAAFYTITATGVKDLAASPNTIVANGTTNVASFFIQNVVFNGDFKLPFCRGAFVASDSMYVEGSISPLTFTVGDNAKMSDANADQIYNATVPFSMPKSTVTGKAEKGLLWKFSHTPSADPFEPGSDRFVTLSSDSGATQTLNGVWGNEQAIDFTDKAVDVIFQVKATLPYLAGTHSLWLTGSQLPLTFNKPGIKMKDDGVAPDAVAGDKIYTLKVRFPKCAPKNVNWKVVYDSTATDTVFECPDQGNRNVYVNSAAFDTVGGALGALILPARGVNRCTVTDKAIAVTFRVSATSATPVPSAADTVAVCGTVAPLSFVVAPPASQFVKDNGVAPDTRAGDHLYYLTVTFPDSSNTSVDYKYWYNQIPRAVTNGFECAGAGNRNFQLDDYNNSVAVPMVRPVDILDGCSVTGVEPGLDPIGALDFAVLTQNTPNPAGLNSQIRFALKQSGHTQLTVYDITGRRVARLIDGPLSAGPHEAKWDARDDAGRTLGSGVYMYELAQNGNRMTRRMILLAR